MASALAYVVRSSRTGPAGLKQITASLISATAADTCDFTADFTKITAASIIGDTKNAPAITPVAGGNIAGTVLTVPAGYAKDDVDLVLIGPSIQA